MSESGTVKRYGQHRSFVFFRDYDALEAELVVLRKMVADMTGVDAENQKLRDIIKEVISTVKKDFPIFAAAIQKQLEVSDG